MDNKTKEQFRSLLLKEKNDIEFELDKIAVKNPQIKGDYQAKFPNNTDGSDPIDERAHEVEEWERSRAIEQELEIKLKEINETLSKINREDYGLCSDCKSPIEPPRLKAMPVTSLCVNCAKKATLV